MAVLDVCEYTTLSKDQDSRQIQCGNEPALAFQQVAIGGSSVACAAVFNERTRFIRVHADAVCRIQIAATPVAAATTLRLAAGATEYFGVTPGHKIAVITTS